MIAHGLQDAATAAGTVMTTLQGHLDSIDHHARASLKVSQNNEDIIMMPSAVRAVNSATQVGSCLLASMRQAASVPGILMVKSNLQVEASDLRKCSKSMLTLKACW